MNKAYRVVFNKATGAWTAVSEVARGRGKQCVAARAAISTVTAIAAIVGATGAVAQPIVQPDPTGPIYVGSSTGGSEVAFANQDGDNRRLTGVSNGQSLTDAANVGQLQTTARQIASALGGGATANLSGSTVTFTQPTYTLGADKTGTTTYRTVDGALGNLDSRIKDNTDNITNLTTQINDGTIGLVQQDQTTRAITVAKSTDGTEVDFAGEDASGNPITRKLLSVTAGTLSGTSTDAINGSQLYATNQAVASMLGTTLNPLGMINAITFTAGGNVYSTVHDAFEGLGNRVLTLENHIGGGIGNPGGGGGGGDQNNPMFASTGATPTSKEAAVASGTNSTAAGANAVASADNSVALGAGSVADRADTVSVGSAGNERIVANVKEGVQETDAVNVKQLNQVRAQADSMQQSISSLQNQVGQLDSRINRVGAMNAAMSTMVASAAGLQTDNRMAIGTGLYRGQTALAIGYQRKVGSRATVTIGGSTAGGSEYNVGVGAGYGW